MNRKVYALIAVVLAIGAALFLLRSWLDAHDDKLKMQATIAAQQQLIAQADTRERDRAVTLRSTLSDITALKRKTQTPAQVLRELPQVLPLPKPIVINSPNPGTQSSAASTPSAEAVVSAPVQQGTALSAQFTGPAGIPPGSAATIPVEDLKPLYDFAQDCRACQARLSVAQADLKDEHDKSAALATERDAAVHAVKGGSLWTRLKRNAKWLAIGVGAGAILARAAH